MITFGVGGGEFTPPAPEEPPTSSCLAWSSCSLKHPMYIATSGTPSPSMSTPVGTGAGDDGDDGASSGGVPAGVSSSSFFAAVVVVVAASLPSWRNNAGRCVGGQFAALLAGRG